MKYEAHQIADFFPMLSRAEADDLRDHVKSNGLIEPIVLYEGRILDGRNRYRACQEAGVELRFVDFPADGDPWEFVWGKNATRRHLEAGTKGAIKWEFMKGSDAWVAARRVEASAANKARSDATKDRERSKDGTLKARQAQSFAPVQTTGSEDGQVAAAPRPVKPAAAASSDSRRLAKEAGISPRTAADIIKLSKEAPELLVKVAAGKMSSKKAVAEVKRQAKKDLGEKLDAAPVDTPEGPFDVIVLDPPWQYTKRAEDHTHRSRLSYPDMTTEEICALPVRKLAGDHCVLWLWTTNAFMRDAFRCLDAWGFTEKTILTWVKDRMGTGDWLRGKTEHCVLAVKGKPMVTLTNQTTVLEASVREHSRKPNEFFAMVDGLCHGAKLEMFARERRTGWMSWGAEDEKF